MSKSDPNFVPRITPPAAKVKATTTPKYKPKNPAITPAVAPNDSRKLYFLSDLLVLTYSLSMKEGERS